MVISIFVLVAAWIKRYLIVVPTMLHPHLPIQNVDANFMVYEPTLHEIAITGGTVILAIMIVTVLSKIFPIIPMWELKHESEKH